MGLTDQINKRGYISGLSIYCMPNGIKYFVPKDNKVVLAEPDDYISFRNVTPLGCEVIVKRLVIRRRFLFWKRLKFIVVNSTRFVPNPGGEEC
jgi:hypothetical protein